jgi:hypothetical protein
VNCYLTNGNLEELRTLSLEECNLEYILLKNLLETKRENQIGPAW